jgi:predicted dinucleotide-binding enzyme
MKIGILGSGNVGGTLGSRWAQGGHTVIFSSRTPDSKEMKDLAAKAGGTSRAALLREAVAASDVLLLATPWPATKAILSGAGDLRGKILIDATNPLLPDLSGLEVGTSTSAGELVAGWAPEHAS